MKKESLIGLIRLIAVVTAKRLWISAKDKFGLHKHHFRKGDVMAEPNNNFCRCYLCGETINIMED